MEKGLLEKTGKPLEHWIEVVKKSGLEKHGEILKHLKSEHGFTHGFANFVSLKARGTDAGSHNPDDLVAAQYAKKPDLKPLYDQLVKEIKAFGDNVEMVPKKANVSMKTGKQFALIQPSTKTRIDIGLKLRNREVEGRLKNSGSFGSMCTHRVEVFSADDIDGELLDLIREAYRESF